MSDERREDVLVGKYDPTMFDPSGDTLLVNEIFYSIQGEGMNAGRAAVFVRLAKCNLACKFCDTEFEEFTRRGVEQVWERVAGCVEGTALCGQDNPLVILTGGEPALQNCGPLIDELHDRDYNVAIETNGTIYAEWMRRLDHVCVSPKVPLVRVPVQLLTLADEFKWIVNAAFMNHYLRDPSSAWCPESMNYLQPESESKQWTAKAVELVKQWRGRYRLSLQTHKILGLR